MTRPSILALHIAAVPAALVGASLVQRSMDVALHKALVGLGPYTVPVHGAMIIVATVVALLCRSFNWPLKAAWVLYILHVVIISYTPQIPPGVPDPSAAAWVYLSVGTARLGLSATLWGLYVSFVRALRSAKDSKA